MGETVPFNMASIWELTVDHCLDRTAIVCGDRRTTYDQMEREANQLAHYLTAQGVGRNDHVGLYLQNCPEYVIAMLACWKIRAVPINVNFRYVADELAYLVDDADLVGLIFQERLSGPVADVLSDAERGTRVGIRIVVPNCDPALPEDSGAFAASGLEAATWATALDGQSAERDFGPRSGDDLYVMYTGGTTGMPKGVVWTQGDAFFACVGAGDPMRLSGPVSDPSEMVERMIQGEFTTFPCAPLIHAAAQWTGLSWWFAGGKVVLNAGSFDGAAVWRAVENEKVGVLIIVGDAMARPLLDAWDAHGPFDASSLFTLSSGGAPLSPVNKDRVNAILPNLMITDGYGSSETGAQGVQRLQPGEANRGNRFVADPATTLVLDDELQPVVPGSGTVGRVARTGRIPLRYHNDPEKTAATFVEVDGKRWVLTGDSATVDEDGQVRLLGRGSACINTGGEKVFPEEVESVVKAHPAVYDAVVTGVADDRFGETVAAIVSLTPGLTLDLESLADHCRQTLAGYKTPRRLVIVDEVVRSPVGKADLRWAQAVAGAAQPA